VSDPLQFQPIAARPSPVRTEGMLPWIRRNLFGDWKNAITWGA
jgi:general L-amino acid transport system permease protein